MHDQDYLTIHNALIQCSPTMKTSVTPPFQLIIQTITNEVYFPVMRSQNVCYFGLIWSADAADLPNVCHSVFINAHSSILL